MHDSAPAKCLEQLQHIGTDAELPILRIKGGNPFVEAVIAHAGLTEVGTKLPKLIVALPHLRIEPQ